MGAGRSSGEAEGGETQGKGSDSFHHGVLELKKESEGKHTVYGGVMYKWRLTGEKTVSLKKRSGFEC